MQIIEKYGLIFSTKDIGAESYPLCESRIDQYSDIAIYIGSLYWVIDVDSEMEDIIDPVLNRQSSYETTGALSIVVEVMPTNTHFFREMNQESANNPLIIPTIDLKEMLEEWKKFLIQINN